MIQGWADVSIQLHDSKKAKDVGKEDEIEDVGTEDEIDIIEKSAERMTSGR